MSCEEYTAKLELMSKEELIKLSQQALYHLRCVSGSRNSYHPDFMVDCYKNGIYPYRQKQVEEMHTDASIFSMDMDEKLRTEPE